MIEVIDETGRLDAEHAAAVRAALGAWLGETGRQGNEPGVPRATVVFLDDDAVRRLNREHRGVDEPTDVLSYPTSEPDDVGFPEVPHLGDVLISLDTAARQAAAAGHGLREELLTLAAHGMVHLLGYDHHTEAEWQVFEAAQSRVRELAGPPASRSPALPPA